MKWLRPSGTIIETGDGEGIRAYAEANGWVPADEASQNEIPDELFLFEAKEEVFNYVLEKTGISIDKRGSLDTVKGKARVALGNRE